MSTIRSPVYYPFTAQRSFLLSSGGGDGSQACDIRCTALLGRADWHTLCMCMRNMFAPKAVAEFVRQKHTLFT
jgi:hypothetical protein